MLDAAYNNAAPDITSAVSMDDRFGRYFQRITEERQLSEEEWLAIPEGKRPPRALTYTRSTVKQLESYGYLGDMGHEARKHLIFR